MRQRKKELIAVATLISSLFLGVIGFLMLPFVQATDVPIVSAAFAVLCIVFLVSVFAVIRYSEDGWRIEGSRLEWFTALIIAPFMALALYFVSRGQNQKEAVDPHDHERLKRL